uniref:S-phase kinase-associated protein 2 n=2 Tax=Ascaris suum TaxID=6253 RepID=F1KZ36_ASCSU
MKQVEKRKACKQHGGSTEPDLSISISTLTKRKNDGDRSLEESQQSTSSPDANSLEEDDMSDLIPIDHHTSDSSIEVNDANESSHLETDPRLRVPPNVDLFYRTPNALRYSLRRESTEDTIDYFKKFAIPTEVILTIFNYLNKKDLMMAILTCRHFRDVGYNPSLWEYMDLGERCITETEVHSLMNRGIRILRLTHAKINRDMRPPLEAPLLHPSPLPSKLTHLDLSGTAPEDPSVVAALLQRCFKLEAVSLEQRVIDDRVCSALSCNVDLQYLNLTMCQGLSPDGIRAILQGCRRLLEVNMAWTNLDVEHVEVAIRFMPRGVRRLNLSGIREKNCLNDEDIMQLIMRCPRIVEVDLSDAPSITERSLKAMLHNLRYLRDLSVSRCYGIEPTALLLARGLRTLNVYGNITLEGVNMLREHLSEVSVNKSPFSTIAVPTHGEHVTSIWGHRTRDLY